MHIGVPRTHTANERRVPLTPDVTQRLTNAGHRVTIEPGAGDGAGFVDSSYSAVGADIGDPWSAELVITLERPSVDAKITGKTILGLLAPFDDPAAIRDLAGSGATLFAFEAVPRTTRAQSMDVLSSQATVAGYQAVLEAAARSDRFFPMLTTAAGTIRPATVLVLGAGVAGLQAIATARRLGAVVSAFDVRSAAAEQVKSLGASFIEIPIEAQEASASGGYARAVAADEERTILAGLAPHIAKADVVISTAAIPGRQAPRLITDDMVAAMRPGAVIVDLAASTGGNCEATEPGSTVVRHGVTIIGDTDLVARTPADASRMLARNVIAFLEVVTGDTGDLAPDWEDEIVRESCVARDGAVTHPRILEALG